MRAVPTPVRLINNNVKINRVIRQFYAVYLTNPVYARVDRSGPREHGSECTSEGYFQFRTLFGTVIDTVWHRLLTLLT